MANFGAFNLPQQKRCDYKCHLEILQAFLFIIEPGDGNECSLTCFDNRTILLGKMDGGDGAKAIYEMKGSGWGGGWEGGRKGNCSLLSYHLHMTHTVYFNSNTF